MRQTLRLPYKHLFTSNTLIKSLRNVELRLEDPVSEDMVLKKTENWEHTERYGFGFPGSVNHNGTHFIMHYIGGRGKKEFQNIGYLGVATSIDGRSWIKTRLEIQVIEGGEHCVFYDKLEHNSKHKYKMIYNCNAPVDETCLAVSIDDSIKKGTLRALPEVIIEINPRFWQSFNTNMEEGLAILKTFSSRYTNIFYFDASKLNKYGRSACDSQMQAQKLLVPWMKTATMEIKRVSNFTALLQVCVAQDRLKNNLKHGQMNVWFAN